MQQKRNPKKKICLFLRKQKRTTKKTKQPNTSTNDQRARAYIQLIFNNHKKQSKCCAINHRFIVDLKGISYDAIEISKRTNDRANKKTAEKLISPTKIWHSARHLIASFALARVHSRCRIPNELTWRRGRLNFFFNFSPKCLINLIFDETQFSV